MTPRLLLHYFSLNQHVVFTPHQELDCSVDCELSSVLSSRFCEGEKRHHMQISTTDGEEQLRVPFCCFNLLFFLPSLGSPLALNMASHRCQPVAVLFVMGKCSLSKLPEGKRAEFAICETLISTYPGWMDTVQSAGTAPSAGPVPHPGERSQTMGRYAESLVTKCLVMH